MKGILLAVIMCCSALMAQYRMNVELNGGVLAQRLTSDPDIWRNSSRIGGHIGLMFRLGAERVYLEPGVNWYVMTQDLIYQDDTQPNVELKAKQSVHGVNVPTLLGVSVIHSKFFELRLRTGPTYTFPTGTDGDGIMERNNISDIIIGWRSGLAIDIWRLAFAIDYELGLSKFYASSMDSKAKSNVLTCSIGLKLGKSGE